MILFVTLYPLLVILVFVAGRYRAPIVPIVSILAAAGMKQRRRFNLEIIERFDEREPDEERE